MENYQNKKVSVRWIICCCLMLLLFTEGPVFGISLGDRVQTTATLNVRSSAAGTAIGQQSSGTQGVTIGGPTTAVLSGTTYTWWNVDFDSGVDGWVAAEAGLSSIAPTTPASPTPGTTTSPGPTTTSASVVLSWSAIRGATYYDLGVRDIASGTLVVNTTTTSTSYTASLTAGKQYRWDVAAGDSAGESTFTTALYFETPASLLSAPTLNGPADGSTGVSTTPTFSWSSVTGANRYWLICSTSLSDLPTDPNATSCPNCVTFGLSGNTDQTSYAPPTVFPFGGTTRTLNTGTTYYWKVQGWNSSGTEGNYSSVRTFTTASAVAPLDPPTLVSPGTSTTPGSSISTTTPQFQWQAMAGGDGYALYISKFNGSTYDVIYDSSTLGDPLTGTSYNLPSGYLLAGGQYRWNMATHNSAGYGTPNANRLYFSEAASGSFFLSFPLPNRDSTTAKINTVFDHSQTSPYTVDGVVVAYTGETGRSQYGEDYVITLNGNALYGYKNSSGTSFTVNGNYAGGGNSTYLYYEGHPGIDYRTTDQAANGQINVLAAADGVAHWVQGSVYNTLWIDHGNGYSTHYLHLSQKIAVDGASVTRGQIIGVSGDSGVPGNPHLHFEVQFNGVPVDPYGWQGSGPDPYTLAVNVNLWNPVSPSCSYSLSSSGNSFGSSGGTGSFNITTTAGCSWAATTGDGWITITSGNNGTGNGTIGYSVSGNGSSTQRSGSISVQGVSYTITQAGISTPVGYPNATWKGPAAAGNYEPGRGGNSLNKIIVHTIEGSASSALSLFQTSGEVVSAHYIVGMDGSVWQLVADTDTAYHCGNYAYNQQSIGIELEGYADGNPAGNFSWQTDAQYTALENLISWLVSQYSIPLDRAHIMAHNQVPSPGGSYPPTTEWGGADNHHDTGAWWNWRRVMTALGHGPSFSVLNVQSATSITTLPQAGAPIVAPATPGQRFVAYDSYAGYYLVFVCGTESSEDYLPGGGEFHWDGWIPAANVTIISGPAQLEVTGVFPQRLNIRSSPTTSAGVIAHTIDGKRHVATGNTATADGYTWREFYLAAANNTLTTGWSISDNLSVINSGGGGPASPTISNFKMNGSTVTVSAPSQTGYNYILEYKNSLSDPTWVPVQTNSGTGATVNLMNSGTTGSSRFYHVRVQ